MEEFIKLIRDIASLIRESLEGTIALLKAAAAGAVPAVRLLRKAGVYMISYGQGFILAVGQVAMEVPDLQWLNRVEEGVKALLGSSNSEVRAMALTSAKAHVDQLFG